MPQIDWESMQEVMRRVQPVSELGEGQGESSGPSSLSWVEDLRVRVGEAGSQQSAVYEITEALREQQRRMEMSIWSDGRGPLTATEATYGSQNREEGPRWVGTATSPGPPITYDDLIRAWEAAPTSTRSTRGEQMRLSGKPDPLTSEEKVKVEQFYRKVLQDGFAQWPLEGLRLPIFINGKMRRICSDTRWSCQEEYIYIGRGLDEGSGDFSSPAARLAVTSTLMGITGHSTSPELIGLLSERLAKVMAGVYDSVVKPLASTADSKPVRRMAWSASGGLASWVDGEWVGLTGEPVAVGTDWIVIDTEEGPIEEELPEVTPQVLFAEPEEIPIPF